MTNSEKIEYIEFTYDLFPERTELCIYDVNPFTIGAEKLVEILSKHNNGEIDLTEAKFSYAFLNISVGIYRKCAGFNKADHSLTSIIRAWMTTMYLHYN